jgi:hypothetical protein
VRPRLAGAFDLATAPESGSKLHALQTLRAISSFADEFNKVKDEVEE